MAIFTKEPREIDATAKTASGETAQRHLLDVELPLSRVNFAMPFACHGPSFLDGGPLLQVKVMVPVFKIFDKTVTIIGA